MAVSDIDTSTTILDGVRSSLPIFVSPTGQNRSAHPSGEINSLEACYYANVPQFLSNASSVSLGEVLAARNEMATTSATEPATLIWQLYIRRDRATNVSQIRQAAAGEVSAIAVTVDVPALGNRETDVAHSQRLTKLTTETDSRPDKHQLKPLANIALEGR